MNSNIGIGRVTKITDRKRLIIEFDSLTGGKGVTAYPADVQQVPEPGDFILYVTLPDGVGQSILYQVLRNNNESMEVEMKSGAQKVTVSDKAVKITNGKYTVSVDNAGVHISGITPMKPCGLQLMPGSQSIVCAAPGTPAQVSAGALVVPMSNSIDIV